MVNQCTKLHKITLHIIGDNETYRRNKDSESNGYT